MKMNKGKGKAKKPLVPFTDAQVAQFKLQINWGRFWRWKKLNDRGFELDKFGIILCTLWHQIIGLTKNMKCHTDDSVKHKKQFHKKIDGADKLYYKSIRNWWVRRSEERRTHQLGL